MSPPILRKCASAATGRARRSSSTTGGDDDDTCRRCDGTGNYREEQERRFVVLRYVVGGKLYSWHRPAETMTWKPPCTVPTLAPGDWKPEREEKPVNLKPTAFAKAKALLAWVCSV